MIKKLYLTRISSCLQHKYNINASSNRIPHFLLKRIWVTLRTVLSGTMNHRGVTKGPKRRPEIKEVKLVGFKIDFFVSFYILSPGFLSYLV
jgi:hypothetical protein